MCHKQESYRPVKSKGFFSLSVQIFEQDHTSISGIIYGSTTVYQSGVESAFDMLHHLNPDYGVNLM